MENQAGLTVSIIVPVYNAEAYLEECLESLTHQTLADIEILLIDDGSTDSSPAIVDRYAQRDPRIRAVHQQNAGVSYSRNVGLDMARGQFVLFVDSDDYIRVDTCEILVANAFENAADIVVFGGKTFPTTAWADDSFACRNRVVSGGDIVDALANERGSIPLMCNKLYTRQLIEEAGIRFGAGLSLGEDHAFQFCLFPFAKTVSYISDQLYFYRSHESSTLTLGDDTEAHDWRICKHLDVVEHVVKFWSSQGWTALYGRLLLTWLVTFLHNDMPFVSFDNRAVASRRIAELVGQYFDDSDIHKVSDVTWKHLDFMLASASVLEEPSLVSFAVVGACRSDEFLGNLESIQNQTEQRIRCLVDVRCETPEVEKAVRGDARCRFVDFQSMKLDGFVELLESSYVIVAPPNCSYQTRAVERLIDRLDSIGVSDAGADAAVLFARGRKRGEMACKCDVLVFEEQLDRIPSVDPYLYVKPSKLKPFRSHNRFSSADFKGFAFSMCSLSTANKLYSLDFLKHHLARGQASACDFLTALSVLPQFSDSISIFKESVFSFDRFCSSDGEMGDFMAQTLRALGDYRSQLRGRALEGFNTAMVLYCLTLDKAVIDYSKEGSLGETIVEALDIARSLGDDAVMSMGRQLLEDAFQSDPNEHRIRKLEAELETSLDEIARLNGDVEALLEDNRELACQVDEVYNSISYRAGRIVTLPMRVAYYGLKKILKRG